MSARTIVRAQRFVHTPHLSKRTMRMDSAGGLEIGADVPPGSFVVFTGQ